MLGAYEYSYAPIFIRITEIYRKDLSQVKVKTMYDKRYAGRGEKRVDEEILLKISEGRSHMKSCDKCASETAFDSSGFAVYMPALAMVYTPKQSFCDLYTEEKGLSRGTIFPKLDKPFLPGSQKYVRGGGCDGCKM